MGEGGKGVRRLSKGNAPLYRRYPIQAKPCYQRNYTFLSVSSSESVMSRDVGEGVLLRTVLHCMELLVL